MSTLAQAPRTAEAWRRAFELMSGERLYSAVEAANAPRFVFRCIDEGYSPAEVKELFRFAAARLAALGTRPPAGGYYDLLLLAKVDTGA